MSDDIEFLVADPSFRGTTTGQSLEKLSTKFGIALHWHASFILDKSKVPSDFRDSTMPSLARKIAPNRILNVAKIGEAEAELKRNPIDWLDQGSKSEVLQELKLLWHVLFDLVNQPLLNKF